MKDFFDTHVTLRLPAPLRQRLNSRLRNVHRQVGRISRHGFAINLIEKGLDASKDQTGRREEGS
jgi:hypothetical protein